MILAFVVSSLLDCAVAVDLTGDTRQFLRLSVAQARDLRIVLVPDRVLAVLIKDLQVGSKLDPLLLQHFDVKRPQLTQ